MTRRGLGSACIFRGTGLHTGDPSVLIVAPAPPGTGISFRTDGGVWEISRAERTASRRHTAISFPDGTSAATVEHLLSALAGMRIDDAMISCDAPELPILDGSALPYVEAFIRSPIVELPYADDPSPCVQRPAAVHAGSSYAAVWPSDRTIFTFVIDYPGTYIGTAIKEICLDDGTYTDEVAPARTFVLAREIEALRADGLALGGSLDCALVVGTDGLEGGASLRVDCEFAAHKLLDFIGDIALCGRIPRGHYLSVRGGHALHGALADTLRRDVMGANDL